MSGLRFYFSFLFRLSSSAVPIHAKQNTLNFAHFDTFHPVESVCASVVGALVLLMIGLHKGMASPINEVRKFLSSVPLLQISHRRLVHTLVGFLG